MGNRFFVHGKPVPALFTFLFTALCLLFSYMLILLNLTEGLLFLMLGLVVYAFFNYPGWVVYSMLGIWTGMLIWVDSQVSPNFPASLMDQGLSAALVATILLITHQTYSRVRRAQHELEPRFQVLSEFAPGFEYWEHPDGTLEYVSPSCEQITGYTPAQYKQNPSLLWDIILPGDRGKLTPAPSENDGKTQTVIKEEIRIQHHSGQIRWVECCLRQAYDQHGVQMGQRISMVDINTRKREIDNLKIRFELLHSALETSEDGIWDLNLLDGQTVFNPRYANLLGLKPGENQIHLKDYYTLIHPDDRPGMFEALKAYITRKTPSYECEYRLLTRFGKWCWVLDRGRVMTNDSSGKPTRMVGTHIDITERKLIQEALRQSEEKFRQLAENMRELFWLRERESGQFIYISPAFNEIWGHTAEQIYADSNLFVESIYWEDFGRVYHALRELVTQGVILNEEYRIQHTDGTERWVWARAYPIYDSNGTFYRIAGIAEDITARKETDSALRDSEKRYRDLIERQGDGVSIIDLYQDILYMNPAGEDIFGVARSSITNHNLREFMNDEQFTFMLGQPNIRQQGTESSFEITINRADATQRSLLFTSTPRFDVNGLFLGAIAIFKDITQRKVQEDKLRYIGLHDGLTGLFNRAHFDLEVEQFEIGDSFPIGIIIVDADDLKQVNDQLGHATGDDLLLRVAKSLKKSVRSGDVVARIGGDEFAILMPNSDVNALYQVLNRIEANIALENGQNRLNYILSVSSGGITAKQRGSLRESIDKADARMYEAKNRKKKRSYYNLPVNNPPE